MKGKLDNKLYQPVFIIGAARSGTNMLRDLMTEISTCATWNCDEINPIWRHFYKNHPNDVFTDKMATDEVCEFIQNKFSNLNKKHNAPIIIEKTCANSLRIPFINKIFPSAKYIFIRREMKDVVASSVLKYKSPFDWHYSLKKLKYTPPGDIPYYVFRFGMNRVRKFFKNDDSIKFWGVQLENMNDKCKELSLVQTCALQWNECVTKSQRDLDHLDAVNVLKVEYEIFVNHPIIEFQKILKFLEIDQSRINLTKLLMKVNSKSIGKFSETLSREELEEIETFALDR